MSTEQEKNAMSAMGMFVQHQETFDDAKKKSNDESGNRATYLRLTQDGTITVRVLPLAPTIDSNGTVTMERKGYEYPVKELVLKIEDTKTDSKGKVKTTFVNVCNAKYAFPSLQTDLIDAYVKAACDLYADDEALCKKLKESSFNGGLKWDSKRCLYVYDMDKRGTGLQILQLSYSQYKELEDRKLKLWAKLMKTQKVPCPISSIEDAYPLEITRKTEKKKTEYSINIDVVSGTDSLSEEELQALLDAPRLPEVLYRYSRFHLEATIAFLHQMDAKMDIDVMSHESVLDCIDQIKLLLPADDQSHFTLGGNNTGQPAASDENGIDALWKTYDQLEEEGLDDKSEEGQNLRASIKEFIEENGMNVRLGRTKTNLDLLNEIEDVLADDVKESDSQEEEAPAVEPKPAAKTPDPIDDEGDGDDEPANPEPTRRRRNEDTNEPAAPRQERRAARPARRR